jgi:hypothetical protein
MSRSRPITTKGKMPINIEGASAVEQFKRHLSEEVLPPLVVWEPILPTVW